MENVSPKAKPNHKYFPFHSSGLFLQQLRKNGLNGPGLCQEVARGLGDGGHRCGSLATESGHRVSQESQFPVPSNNPTYNNPIALNFSYRWAE